MIELKLKSHNRVREGYRVRVYRPTNPDEETRKVLRLFTSCTSSKSLHRTEANAADLFDWCGRFSKDSGYEVSIKTGARTALRLAPRDPNGTSEQQDPTALTDDEAMLWDSGWAAASTICKMVGQPVSKAVLLSKYAASIGVRCVRPTNSIALFPVGRADDIAKAMREANGVAAPAPRKISRRRALEGTKVRIIKDGRRLSYGEGAPIRVGDTIDVAGQSVKIERVTVGGQSRIGFMLPGNLACVPTEGMECTLVKVA